MNPVSSSPLLTDSSSLQSSHLLALIDALRILPGVGPKTAQRYAYYLMQHDRTGSQRLGELLILASKKIQHCQCCNTLSESDICPVCSDTNRDTALLCVVETPADQIMLEQTLSYKGLYFVLMGHLSPLDGMGPNEINLNKLYARVLNTDIKEVILATNFTNEGELTAHYIAQELKAKGLKVTRLARGISAGGELEYTDSGTIACALLDRRHL